MKIIASAIALAFAVPVVAQTAPAQPQHPDHSQAAHAATAQAPHAGHAGHQMPPAEGSHKGHAMKDGCCADRDGNGKMDCCEKMAAKSEPDQTAQPQGHQNH